MLRIGNQTSCWTTTPTEPFEYALARQFGAFEWFPDKKPGVGWDDADLDSNAREAIRERAGASGMRLSVHARWQANLFSEEGRALIMRDIELARDLDAALLNIHLEHERGLEAFLDAILPLVEHTAKAGLQLAIENTPLHAPEQFNELFSRLGSCPAAGMGHVGMCFDMGHAN
ncbi:MAG: sugar phosphate isomerase/epimerase family protein, partial [Limisphaerales bacterium]